MNWSRWLTVTKGTTQTSPVTLEAEVTLGMVEEVKVYFPPGCLGYVKATLFFFEDQVLPRHPQGYISGDDYLFVLPMDYEIKSRPAIMRWECWNTAATYNHTIYLEIFVREPAEETAESLLKRLLKALVGE